MNINQLIERSRRRRLPVPPDRRRIRIAAGISQAELGDALSVSRAAIARWEKGSRVPSRKFAGITPTPCAVCKRTLRHEPVRASRQVVP